MEQTRILGDPNRQATDSIGGYLYQFWQTLLAWLDLKPSELLYIEGAEDIDLVSDAQSIAVQVKRTSAAISLNTNSVQKAISNFWSIKELNSGRPIQYRFITTSNVAQEQRSPFGQGVSGLMLWNDCSNEVDAKKILDHLCERAKQTDSSIIEPLKLWLKSVTAEEILNELIHPIRWVVNSPTPPEIERVVEEKLVYLGESQSIAPRESKKAKPHLLTVIIKLASTKEPKPLTRASLLEEFETSTSISVPMAFHRQALDRFSPSPTTTVSVSVLFEDVPKLPSGISMRRSLCEKALESLNSICTLYLHGSSGMGKSTIAKILTTADSRIWKWLNVSTMNPTETIRLVRMATLDTNFRDMNLVLDDLRFDQSSIPEMENSLSSLITLMRSRNTSTYLH